MEEHRAWSRVYTRRSTAYSLAETPDEVMAKLEAETPFIEVTFVSAQGAFPPERTFLRSEEIMSIQDMSDESWVWQKVADERHYAKFLNDSPLEKQVESFRELIELLKREASE